MVNVEPLSSLLRHLIRCYIHTGSFLQQSTVLSMHTNWNDSRMLELDQVWKSFNIRNLILRGSHNQRFSVTLHNQSNQPTNQGLGLGGAVLGDILHPACFWLSVSPHDAELDIKYLFLSLKVHLSLSVADWMQQVELRDHCRAPGNHRGNRDNRSRAKNGLHSNKLLLCRPPRSPLLVLSYGIWGPAYVI